MTYLHSLMVVALATLAAACSRVPESVEIHQANMAAITTGASSTAPDPPNNAGPPTAPCKGNAGPRMVALSAPSHVAGADAGGLHYCIDVTEVTQGQYAEFLKGTTTPPGSEHPRCADNRSYLPDVGPSYPNEPRNCELAAWAPDATPDKPVVCVDWCDAVAYCRWAGKHLCGKVGGGDLAIEESDNPSASEWYNACSEGGTHAYPYGDNYEPQPCLGADRTNLSHAGNPTSAVGPAGEHRACVGTAGPFASLVDLSGSVQEWTDECTWHATAEGGGWLCAVRGGDYLSDAAGLACRLTNRRNIGAASAHFGFRCCSEPR